MIRVLYWNIRNFSLSKVQGLTPPAAVEAQARIQHIVNQVVGPHPPDIFVVVEVYSRTMDVSVEGDILGSGSNAGLGVQILLEEMRALLGVNTWCVVPPVKIGGFGKREAVAVFYNAATVQFVGPYVLAQPTPHDLVLARPPTPVNLANLQDYDINWEDTLPNPTNPLPGLKLERHWPGAAAVPEWQSAGQFEFADALGKRINWPGAEDRSPFYTRFIHPASGRILKLFAVHTSPGVAAQAVQRLPLIQELAPAANEISLVVGDFNVDSFNPAENGAYAGISATHLMALDPRAGGAVVPARKPYCMTHLLPATYTPAGGAPVQVAFPFNATGMPKPDPQHNAYPRFGYMGSIIANALNDSGAIDNAFINYAAGMVPPNHNVSIVNTVVGKPYAAPAPGVWPELTGGLGYAQTLVNAIPAGGVNPPAEPVGFNFAHWLNFGRIYSTSDHLALLVDV